MLKSTAMHESSHRRERRGRGNSGGGGRQQQCRGEWRMRRYKTAPQEWFQLTARHARSRTKRASLCERWKNFLCLFFLPLLSRITYVVVETCPRGLVERALKLRLCDIPRRCEALSLRITRTAAATVFAVVSLQMSCHLSELPRHEQLLSPPL